MSLGFTSFSEVPFGTPESTTKVFIEASLTTSTQMVANIFVFNPTSATLNITTSSTIGARRVRVDNATLADNFTVTIDAKRLRNCPSVMAVQASMSALPKAVFYSQVDATIQTSIAVTGNFTAQAIATFSSQTTMVASNTRLRSGIVTANADLSMTPDAFGIFSGIFLPTLQTDLSGTFQAIRPFSATYNSQSSVEALARYLWETESIQAENWNTLAVTSETWTPVSTTSETWNHTNPPPYGY